MKATIKRFGINTPNHSIEKYWTNAPDTFSNTLIQKYFVDSKILQYLGNVRHYSEANEDNEPQ